MLVLPAHQVPLISKTAIHQALMDRPRGAVVAVVEALLPTPPRPTAECKGAERKVEAVKAERKVEAAKVERKVEAVKAVRVVKGMAVVVKIMNCLKSLSLRLEKVMVSLIGAALSLMVILEHLGHLLLFLLPVSVLKIFCLILVSLVVIRFLGRLYAKLPKG
ncbi:hypothetical protein HMPREF3052_00015 [Neisseria sp. HMSC056A03]|nr:hypothetical protein HMPREF3052_00015 [Neisseria sp. HMSC056A03]